MDKTPVLYCATGEKHDLSYLGREAQAYSCNRCGVVVSKHDLKLETDLKGTPQGLLYAEVKGLRAEVAALKGGKA